MKTPGARKRTFRLLLTAAMMAAVQFASACDCGEQLPEFTKEETEKYGLIFIGTIDSLQDKEQNGTAWFRGLELYRGLATPRIAIRYDNYTSCRMSFREGQTWMIYAVKDSVTSQWTVSYCSRSRRLPEQGETDEYTIYSNLTYEEEKKFLASIYPRRDFIPQETINEIDKEDKTVIDSNRELIHATGRQKIFLILGSVAGLVLIYLVVKKWLK